VSVSAVLTAPWNVRARVRRWLTARLPRSDSQLLTQANVYILPTRAGWMFALTLIVLLLASINYQLNLGYLLTFLLAGSGVVSMHITHGTLRGLTLHLRPVAPAFAGSAAVLDIVLSSPTSTRFGIGLRLLEAPVATLAWTNVPAGGQATAHVSYVPGRRGLHDVPTLTAETRFPLGLFRAWTVWRPVARVLVYPQVEADAPALPAARPVSGAALQARRSVGGEIEGVRAYRRGDPLKLIAWKKAAQALATGAVDADQGAAAVGRVGSAVDQPLAFEATEGAGDGRPLDPLDRGDLARGQRAVALDRRQRGDRGRGQAGGLRRCLLAQPAGGADDRRAQLRGAL
jgi:hypothetical protein